METVDMQYTFKKNSFVLGLAKLLSGPTIFVQMKLGTEKKITFISSTVTWKSISFGLDILH